MFNCLFIVEKSWNSVSFNKFHGFLKSTFLSLNPFTFISYTIQWDCEQKF